MALISNYTTDSMLAKVELARQQQRLMAGQQLGLAGAGLAGIFGGQQTTASGYTPILRPTPTRPQTLREELQAETDEWLDGIN